MKSSAESFSATVNRAASFWKNNLTRLPRTTYARWNLLNSFRLLLLNSYSDFLSLSLCRFLLPWNTSEIVPAVIHGDPQASEFVILRRCRRPVDKLLNAQNFCSYSRGRFSVGSWRISLVHLARIFEAPAVAWHGNVRSVRLLTRDDTVKYFWSAEH